MASLIRIDYNTIICTLGGCALRICRLAAKFISTTTYINLNIGPQAVSGNVPMLLMALESSPSQWRFLNDAQSLGTD